MEDNNYAFDFKLVNGAYSKSYIIDVSWTMEFFLANIKEQIKEDFHLDQTKPISIIESGQYFNTNGRDPELAHELTECTLTLREYFNKRLSSTAFYVRC